MSSGLRYFFNTENGFSKLRSIEITKTLLLCGELTSKQRNSDTRSFSIAETKFFLHRNTSVSRKMCIHDSAHTHDFFLKKIFGLSEDFFLTKAFLYSQPYGLRRNISFHGQNMPYWNKGF